jgi:hypothetical protein
MNANYHSVRRAHRLLIAVGKRALHALLGGGKGGNEERDAEKGNQNRKIKPFNHGGDRITRDASL